MSKQKKAADAFEKEELVGFFGSAISEQAARGLSESACMALVIDGKTFFFTRKKGKNHIVLKEPTRPDVWFWIPKNAMRHFIVLASEPAPRLAILGAAIFEKMFSRVAAEKVEFRVDASFLTLFTKGYFSVLKAGGPEVVSYLARWGFSFSKIKDILLKVKD